MQRFFITATGTDIGKTLITTTLCWQLRARGRKVTALKPIISGFKEGDPASDSALILQSCGLATTPELIQEISPWRFEAPLAPNLAAAREGKKIALDEVVTFCRDHEQSDMLLVEGPGGVMSPVSDEATVLDWMQALGWPAILVAGSYLGAISHTLTALEALRARGIMVRMLIVSESENSGVTLEDTVSTLEKFVSSDICVLKFPRLHVTQEPWKHASSIRWTGNI